MSQLIPGYAVRSGSTLDRALLVKFMQRTYQELHPGQPIAHLAQTVEQYFSVDTPLWWVERLPQLDSVPTLMPASVIPPIACLWMGNAVDQIRGDRHAHIFLVYVVPTERRRGIGAALLRQAEAWARERGDRQIGLQVFCSNQAALHLYEKSGYQPQSIWMVKGLE